MLQKLYVFLYGDYPVYMAVFITILGILGIMVILSVILFILTVIAASPAGFIAFKVITFFKRCIYGDDDEEDDAYILHRLFKDDYQMRDRNAASQFRNEQARIQEGVRTEPAPRPGATNAVATEDSPYSRRHQRPSGEDDDFSYDDFLYDYDDFPYDD